MHEAKIKTGAQFFIFIYIMFRYSCNTTFWEPWKFCEKYQKC